MADPTPAGEASPYRDCGKCPYLGGCTHCDHSEWREIIYARVAAARLAGYAEGVEAAAMLAKFVAVNPPKHTDTAWPQACMAAIVALSPHPVTGQAHD
ncbi:hypothetical protein UFOVP1020_14 [uncultured Caudovirales phage]|uniref:Uncharacterized protein n=1 Tax=uncultured Caudovirales phage TaxID=2100421 RepID=A0A6J5Q3I0_9CAUD|nr:hypothetical protein UFOVP512_19 [uncultured Caudovirales phage]CAB4178673.1 hypothetical protein UFOVP1020_14 [uncultured Caudovirales phage]CAB4187881.1 hypothetical protein UFOVP1170_9 [uncultured Caudovirales phage]CAB4220484.1 hypothetical protein UFOVP1621_36 [uncultured Caudovirales phage]